MLFVVALLVALVSAEDNFVPLVEEHLIGVSYDEDHDRHRNLFHVQRLDDKTVGLDSVLQARLFQNGAGEVYIGTSMYNNYVTYNGALPVLKWNVDDGDDDGWSVASIHPTTRATGFDAQSAINYFTTNDKVTWAYDALYAYQNNTVRQTGISGGNGTSYLYKMNGDSFDGTAAFSLYTNFSTSRSAYFQTSDGREFLWTFSWGGGSPPSPAPPARTPVISDNRNAAPQRCSLIEYKGDSWVVSQYDFIGCPTRPRSPLSFANVVGNWVYLFPSFQGGAVVTLTYRGGALSTQWEITNDVLDNFVIPDAGELTHWVDDGYDMITATTPGNVRTYRLHWDTHEVEELPAVPAVQGAPYDLSWLYPGGRTCFVIGSATYNGLRDISPVAVHQYFTSIYCWDGAKDVWDLALRFPAEWTWFNQVFPDPETDDDDDDAFYLVTFQRAHLTTVNVKTYHITYRGDDDIHIRIEEGPNVSVEEQTRWAGHVNRHIAITTLSFVLATLVLALVTLFLSMSGGGGSGSSGDYASFNQ